MQKRSETLSYMPVIAACSIVCFLAAAPTVVHFNAVEPASILALVGGTAGGLFVHWFNKQVR